MVWTSKPTPQWNKYEEQFAGKDVEIVYLPHTDGIFSTLLTGVIKNILDEQPEKSGGGQANKEILRLLKMLQSEGCSEL